MFNHKCEAVAEFGEGARNTVLVNPVGNIVLVGGFGNISPRYEVGFLYSLTCMNY